MFLKYLRYGYDQLVNHFDQFHQIWFLNRLYYTTLFSEIVAFIELLNASLDKKNAFGAFLADLSKTFES